MDTLEQSLGEIKGGIQTVLKDQSNLDIRVKSLETYLNGKGKFGGAGISLPGVESHKFSFAKAFAIGKLTADGKLSQAKGLLESYTGKVLLETTQKALDSGTGGSGGGYVIPSEVMSDIIDMMRASAEVIGLGVTVLDNLTGSPVLLPKQLTAGSIAWYGQNATIAKADTGFGDVQLTPKIAAMRCQFSNLLGILSNPAIEELVRRDFAMVLALELDRVILEGSGTSNQPTGILNMSSVQTHAIGTNGGVFDWDQATDMLGKLEDANVPSRKLGLAWHPKVKRMLKKVRVPQYSGDTKGSYVTVPFVSDAKLKDTLGLPFANSTQIATNLSKGSGSNLSRVYAADWSEVILGLWGSAEILATNVGGDAWAQNAVEARIVVNADVAARHPESIVICSDAATA